MNEPLTSNPLNTEPRWRYRIQQDRGQYCLKQCDDGDLVDYAEAKAIIERLTAELRGTKDELHSVDKAAKELGAERDRLAHANKVQAEEILELRAALERIAQEACEGRFESIARRALAGAADERTPRA